MVFFLKFSWLKNFLGYKISLLENNLKMWEYKEINDQTQEIKKSSETTKQIFETLEKENYEDQIIKFLKKNPHNANRAGLAAKKPLYNYSNFQELLSFEWLSEIQFLQLLKTDKNSLASIMKKDEENKRNWTQILIKWSEFEKENWLEKHLTHLLELIK